MSRIPVSECKHRQSETAHRRIEHAEESLGERRRLKWSKKLDETGSIPKIEGIALEAIDMEEAA
jgi:hypothetical protein